MKKNEKDPRTIQLINKLTNGTKIENLIWNILNTSPIKENIYVKEVLFFYEGKYMGDPYISVDESFFIKHKTGYIFVFKVTKEIIEETSRLEFYEKIDEEYSYYLLAIQPSPESPLIFLNTLEDFQSELFVLFSLIERQYLGLDSFIDDFLKND